MAFLPKVIYRVTAVLIKIPVTVFIEKGGGTSKINTKQETTDCQSYLSRRGITGNMKIPDLKLYHSRLDEDSGTVLKTVM